MKPDDLTKPEQENVRTALRGLVLKLGTRERTYKVLRLHEETFRLMMGGAAVTSSMAIRTARVLKTSVDDLLEGRYRPSGRCPYCGRHEG